MVSIGDVEVWENRLQQEVEGLKYCLTTVNADTTIPATIKTRFRDIVTALNDNIYQVLGRCRQLRSEGAVSTVFEKRAERLHEEYRNVLRNIDKLLKTVETQKIPKNRREIAHLTSRSPEKTSKSAGKRSKSAANLTEKSSPNPLNLSEITSELKELKETLRHVKHRVEKHTHEKYEVELREAREENDRLWGKLHAMQEEQTRLMQVINALASRLDALQSGESREEKGEPRLLAKRSGEAAKMLQQ